MADHKVFIFAPADETGESHRALEATGCELTLGQAGWMTPQGDNEQEMVGLAQGADALMGTSIRSSPITRTIMESSPQLRIVAKYTIGVDDIDVDAATELGILVVNAPTANMLSATEANLRPRDLPEGARVFEKEPVKQASQGDWFWRIPLLVAIGLLILEAIIPGVLSRRRKSKRRKSASRRRSS